MSYPSSTALVSAADAQRMLLSQFSGMSMTAAERDALDIVSRLLVRRNEEEQRLGQMLQALVPGVQAGAVSYNAHANVFVTKPYTSLAGNTYYSGVRMSESLIIKTDIGNGYCYTFLNGVYLYSADGNKTLLGRRQFHSYVYKEEGVIRHAIEMAQEVILQGLPEPERAANQEQARVLAQRCVLEAYANNQVEQVRRNVAGLLT